MAGRANWFIALPVVAEQLPAGIIASLPPGLRRLHPDDLHVTVAFLGPVVRERALASWAATGEIAEGPFEVDTRAPAGLGRPERPSALGLDLGPGPDEGLGAWIERWRDRLREAAGVEAETRPARPHVTLARPPRRAGATIRRRARAWLEETRPPCVRLHLERIALYTAAEGSGPRRFQRVHEQPLPPAPGPRTARR